MPVEITEVRAEALAAMLPHGSPVPGRRVEGAGKINDPVMPTREEIRARVAERP